MSFEYTHSYNTADEIAFLVALAIGRVRTGRVECDNGWRDKGSNHAAFRNYAEIVLSGARVYDTGVDVNAVRDKIRELMPIVDGRVV